MADVTTRLKLESGEYDSKIKRATQGLLQMEQECRKAGKSMNDMEKDNLQFVQSLGSMQTVSTSVRGKIGELSGAFVELRSQYNRLTDEEKKGDFGKGLSGSLDQLKTRVAEAKAELRDINAELENIGKGGGGGMLAGLKDKMGGAVQVFAGNIMTQAANSIQDTVSQSIQLAQAAEGIEVAFNRLNRPDLLDQLKEATHGTVSEIELMKAAVKFDDFKLPVEELGTMLAFAQQKAKDTGQSVDYMVNSIVTGLGRKSKLILDNLGISAAEIDERMKETGDMTKAVGEIIREQMAKAGDYVETASDRAARAAAEQQNAMRRLGKEIMPIAGMAANVFSAIRVAITGTIGTIVEYRGAILSVTAGVAGYAAVVKGATVVTAAHTAATKVATIATKAFNLAMKANPIGLVVAGLTAATTAIIAFAGKSSQASAQEEAARRVRIQQMQREGAERDRLAQRAKTEAEAISAATGDKMAKYEMLRNEWSRLQTEQQKNTFIKNNANLFSELGLSINSSADAMKAFVTNSAKVIEALDSMAKAEALKDLLKDAYKQQYSTPAPDRSQYRPTTDEMVAYAPGKLTRGPVSGKGGFTQKEIQDHIQKYIDSRPELKQAGFNTGDYRVTYLPHGKGITFSINAAGANKLSDYRQQIGTQKLSDENNAYVKGLQDQLTQTLTESLQKQAAAGVFSTPGITTTGGSGGKNTTPPPKGSVAYLTNLMSELGKEQQLVTDTAGWDAYDEKIRMVRLSIKELKGELNSENHLSEKVFQNIMSDKMMKVSISDLNRKNLAKFKTSEEKRQEKLQSQDLKPKEVSEKKNEEKREVKLTDAIGQIGSGLSGITSGMEQLGIEIPQGLQNVVNGIQTVTSILSGIASVVTAIQAISTANLLKLLAGGGIVGRAAGGMYIPGNSFSGDRLRMPIIGGGGMIGVNSGELILNRSQQNALAHQLSENSQQEVDVQPFVDGERIFLGMNNTSRRMGRGEIVTTSTLRRLGLI